MLHRYFRLGAFFAITNKTLTHFFINIDKGYTQLNCVGHGATHAYIVHMTRNWILWVRIFFLRKSPPALVQKCRYRHLKSGCQSVIFRLAQYSVIDIKTYLYHSYHITHIRRYDFIQWKKRKKQFRPVCFHLCFWFNKFWIVPLKIDEKKQTTS